jgi:hypothetical protein
MSTFDQIYLGMVIAGMSALWLTLAWAVFYTRKTDDAPKAVKAQEAAEIAPKKRLAA